MRAVVQRVDEAQVRVGDKIVGAIGRGLMVLLGVEKGDTVKDARYLGEKVAGLRIFEDGGEKMNLSLRDMGGSVLAVSQFTLLGDVRKGKRPSFDQAEGPEAANQLYEEFVAVLRGQGLNVATGVFRAHMLVSLVNNGPVTILLDSKKMF